jgi:hypothetical protein
MFFHGHDGADLTKYIWIVGSFIHLIDENIKEQFKNVQFEEPEERYSIILNYNQYQEYLITKRSQIEINGNWC